MGCRILQNTGEGNPRCYIGPIVGGFFSEELFSLTKSNFILDASWNTLLLGAKPDRVYPLFNTEDPEIVTQREARQYTDKSGKNHYLGSTPLTFKIAFNKPHYYEIRNKLLEGLGDAEGYVIFVTSLGYLIGRENISGSIEAVKCTVNKNSREAEDYSTPAKLEFIFTEMNPESDNEGRYWAKPTAFNPLNKEGINDVILAQISASSTSLVISATLAGSEGTIPVSTFVTADFEATGAGSISSVAYSSATGYYTITGTGFSDSTIISLKAPATTTKFYEADPLTMDVT